MLKITGLRHCVVITNQTWELQSKTVDGCNGNKYEKVMEEEWADTLETE